MIFKNLSIFLQENNKPKINYLIQRISIGEGEKWLNS